MQAQVVLCCFVSLPRGPDEPLDGCGGIFFHSAAGLIAKTQITLSIRQFLLGGGLMYTVAGPLALTAEFNWRPTAGYSNDVYEKQLQARSTAAPDPSRNGVAWTGLFGVALSL